MTNNEFVVQGPYPDDAELTGYTPKLPTKERHYTLKTAGFWVRFWAFLIDSLVISAVIGICINPIFHLMDWSLSDSAWYAPISIISAVIYYLYFVLMTKFLGQTLGKMAFGLRVVSLKHETLSWSDVIYREWIGRFISNFIKLLYVFVAILPNNQGLHDYFADTMVVHEKIYVEKDFEQPVPTTQKTVKQPEMIEESTKE
ncbi:RDD family protein [Lysinibacillus sp. NPDC096418]|uniref:RDD family protein n=1 Tax=Lysinibacillus sp. NPDC096418 TaxID=3364138 RepID=UPI00381A06A2